MSGNENEKEKKELHWSSAALKTLKMRKIIPQTLICKVTEEEEIEGQLPRVVSHNFQTDKVYVFLDEKGQELDGVVVCPEHQQPISVNLVKQPTGNQPSPPTV